MALAKTPACAGSKATPRFTPTIRAGNCAARTVVPNAAIRPPAWTWACTREIGLATGALETEWPRACTRGAVIGLVVAAHVALYITMVIPAKPGPARANTTRDDANVLHVMLLPPASTPRRESHPATRRMSMQTPLAQPRRVARERKRSGALQAVLAPAPATATTAAPPDFIAGGGFDARLRAAQAAPLAPKLPGGHQYLASGLRFQTIAQRSIAGKVHKVAGMLFGGFDPVCKNTEYELAKTREQMLDDGYTMRELERRLREHHCN